MLDKNVVHRPRRGKKRRDGLLHALAQQAKIRLVHERGWLEGVRLRKAAKLLAGKHSQFFINEFAFVSRAGSPGLVSTL